MVFHLEHRMNKMDQSGVVRIQRRRSFGMIRIGKPRF